MYSESRASAGAYMTAISGGALDWHEGKSETFDSFKSIFPSDLARSMIPRSDCASQPREADERGIV